MKLKEKNEILAWVNGLSDEELKKEYYSSVYECLGSEAEIMEELCYDEADIKERRAYEKFIDERSDVLELECEKRGIKLWQKSK